jgi:hypothetical protein
MDRCFFIQDDIGCQYIDNFMLIPHRTVVGRVVEPCSEEYNRMSAFFQHTH